MAGKETIKYISNAVRRLDLTFKFNDSQVVDGGAAVGTYTALKKLPAGSKVLGTKVKVTEAFTGNVSATATVGKAAATDDYFGTAQSVFTAADLYGLSATIAEEIVAAATAPIVTITGSTDYTAVTAGRMTVSIYYLDLNAKPF